MRGDRVVPTCSRHACGFALANAGHDTRALQTYLGDRNINTRCDTPDWHSIGSGSFGGNSRHPRKGVLNLGIGWPKIAYFWRFVPSVP